MKTVTGIRRTCLSKHCVVVYERGTGLKHCIPATVYILNNLLLLGMMSGLFVAKDLHLHM